jgi:DNA-binding NarL/FixJ family response regulator
MADPGPDTRREAALARVAIFSPVRLLREGLAELLADDGLVVVATAASPAQLLAEVRRTEAKIALVDTTGGHGAATVRMLARGAPGVRIAALWSSMSEDEVMALAQAGVQAYVTRDDALDDLRKTIASLARGEPVCPPVAQSVLLRCIERGAAAAGNGDRARMHAAARLTPRELEVLGLIARREPNKRIARELDIELATVKNHVHSILEKLDVSRRADAVAVARASGRLPEADWLDG